MAEPKNKPPPTRLTESLTPEEIENLRYARRLSVVRGESVDLRGPQSVCTVRSLRPASIGTPERG
jgi:hypothetical protein